MIGTNAHFCFKWFNRGQSGDPIDTIDVQFTAIKVLAVTHDNRISNRIEFENIEGPVVSNPKPTALANREAINAPVAPYFGSILEKDRSLFLITLDDRKIGWMEFSCVAADKSSIISIGNEANLLAIWL